MLGLEPRDELLPARGVVLAHESKADEGVHLVNVSPDGFAPLRKLPHVAVRGHGEEVTFAAVGETPEHAIENAPASRVAVRSNDAGDVEKGGRHFWHSNARGGIVRCGEKAGLVCVV